MLLKKKNNEPQLSAEAANKILANVFDACGKPPNEVPLDTLVSYSNYRRDRFSLQRRIVIAVLLLFIALPVFFYAPSYTISPIPGTGGTPEDPYPTYEIRINSILPISTVKATIDGHNLTVSERTRSLYTVHPIINGSLDVHVEHLNHQYRDLFYEIADIDETAPAFLSSEVKDGEIIVFVKDDGIGIRYDSIYAEDADGRRITPKRCDEASDAIVFDFPNTTLDVYISDYCSNTRHIILKVK